MRGLRYEQPDGHYDERLRPTDEQICELMERRKKLTDGKPGRPPKAMIAEWAEKYGFYENFLYAIFNNMDSEELYKPEVKPENFRYQLPVRLSGEQGGIFYSIATMRQYDNASVVVLSADWHEEEPPLDDYDGRFNREHREFVLEIAGDRPYECRAGSGAGTMGKMSQNYVISPALPDDLSGIEFRVRGYEGYGRMKPLGPELTLS